MKSPTRLQFQVEFRRIWTLSTIIGASLIVAFGWFDSLAPYLFNQTGILTRPLRLAEEIEYRWYYLWVITAYFSIGIVGSDIRNGWFRSMIARPITRQRFLAVKLLAALASIWITLIIAKVLPLFIYIPLAKAHVEYRILEVVWGTGLLLGCSITYLAMCSWLSCWLPSFLNAAIFAVWAIGNYMVKDTVNRSAWDRWIVNVATRYLYPDGFADAITAIVRHARIASDVIWGVASLAGFLALAFWQITRIQVDKGTEQA